MSSDGLSLRLDRRVLGALQPLDAATGAPLRRVLRYSSPQARLWVQRSGLVVVGSLRREPALFAPGAAADVAALAAHAEAFEAPPAAPALGALTIEIQVHDPAREYQDTVVGLALPRAADPAAAAAVLKPQPLPLARTGAAPVSPNWTVLHATVLRGEAPLAGACLSLDVGSGAGARSVRALTDATGQAVLALVDQPLFALGPGGALRRSVAARLRLRPAPPSPPGAPPLADVMAELARLAALAPVLDQARTLATGATTHELIRVPP